MKHLKQLAYNVIQFRLKETFFVGIISASPLIIVFSNPLWWLISMPASFIGSMLIEHKKYKLTGKY